MKNSNKFSIKLKSFSFKTPFLIYALHRWLFRATNGRWNDAVSKIISLTNGVYSNINHNGSIFNFMDADLDQINTTLIKDGYCILSQKLPDAIVEELNTFSKNTPAQAILPAGQYGSKIVRSTEKQPPFSFFGKAAKVQHSDEVLLSNKTIVGLACDSFFLAISQRYLRSKPILDFVTMWWTFPVENQEKFSNAAAQLFHYDMDRLKFIKFFFYLTDVSVDTGPHVYVKGSHRSLPRQFRRRGRFSDADVVKYYGERVCEINAPKGTIIAVDTRGIHKGKPLTTGHRLLLQLEYTNSLFGHPYAKVDFNNDEIKKLVNANGCADSFFNFI